MKFSQSRKPYSSSSSSSARQSYGRQAAKAPKKASSWKKINQFNMLNALAAFADGNQFEEEMPSMVKVRLILRNTNIRDEEGNEYSQEEAAHLLAHALLEGRGINVYLFLNEDGSYGGNGRINVKDLEEEQEQEQEEEEKQYAKNKLVHKAKADRSRPTGSGRGSRKSAAAAAPQFDDDDPDSPIIIPHTRDDEEDDENDYVVVDE
jgi:hypothetical protein